MGASAESKTFKFFALFRKKTILAIGGEGDGLISENLN